MPEKKTTAKTAESSEETQPKAKSKPEEQPALPVDQSGLRGPSQDDLNPAYAAPKDE